MLIVEGTDMLGKTTLCHALLKQFQTHVYSHLSRLPSGWDPYWSYIHRACRNTVQDRYHMSELAYAAARGDGGLGLTVEKYRLVDAHLRKLGAYTVLLVASEKLLVQRYEELSQRGEMYKLDIITRANDHFRWLSKQRFVDCDRVIHLTTDEPYADEHEVGQIAREYRERLDLVNTLAKGQPQLWLGTY